MKFSQVYAMRVPNGAVARIRSKGSTMWEKYPIRARYVSLGDSIAAGHTIDADWEKNYGEKSQYGKNGNTETKIVANCSTDLIRKDLLATYGDGRILVVSFARSGDTVADLVEKLDHDRVKDAVSKAGYVTVCIGANDVLQPAFSHLEEYIMTASLAGATAIIEANMTTLNNDSAATSFVGLFNKLSAINPRAKFAFTTVYNPYKYLYLHPGHNGFFAPLLDTIPEIRLDVDEIVEDKFGFDDLGYFDVVKWEWVSIELNANISSLIKDGLLGTPAVQTLFDRTNALGAISEGYVTRLNEILRNKINGYTNPNFVLAETKALFDQYPDKTDSTEDVDYSDLVNVEFTRNYNFTKMDWGALWAGSDAGTFWIELAWKHLHFSNALPSTNVWDYVSFDLNGFAEDLVEQIITKVIVPDVDPHPEEHGHIVMKQSFAQAFGWQ